MQPRLGERQAVSAHWLDTRNQAAIASYTLNEYFRLSKPASSRRTLTSGFSASWRATTEPELPDPQTIKSYCDLETNVPGLGYKWR